LIDEIITAPETCRETEFCAADRRLHGLLGEQDINRSVKRKTASRVFQIHSSMTR
jgi:hypothetical protein